MAFTNKPAQIFEAGNYAYSVEYAQNGPYSNISGITRREFGGTTWENISEIETYLGTVGGDVNTDTFVIKNHKVYRNGVDIVISFVTIESYVDFSPTEYRLHIFKSADGNTFPTHLNNVIKHGQGDTFITYYRDNDFYNIGNYIYHDRFNFLLKFDESMTLVSTEKPFFNLVNAGHSYGDLRYRIDTSSNGSIEIDITDVTDGSRTVQLYTIDDFFTAPDNKFNAADTNLIELNGQLFLIMGSSLDLPPAKFYVPVTTGGMFFDFANAVKFDGDNLPFLTVQYSAELDKFYYLRVDSSATAIIREADTLVGGDDVGWTEYTIPDTGTGLETILNSGGSFMNFRYHEARDSYVFACTISSFAHYYEYDKTTLTDHSGDYSKLIMSDGAGFLRKHRYDFQELAYSTDLVTWTDSDYDDITYGNDANHLAYYPDIGYVASPYGYNSPGVWYSVNGVNWFLASFGQSGGTQINAAEPNKVRYDISNDDYSESNKTISYVTLNSTTHVFDVLASGIKNWFQALSKPYIVRNNVTDVTKLIVMRDDLTGFIISSDGIDSEITLSGIEANYEVRGIAAFYDAGELFLTSAYFDAGSFKLDILSFNGTVWEVDLTIDISTIYGFDTCEFDSDGGPVTVTKAGGYYFVFGKLINLTRVSPSQTMGHFDILLRGSTLDSVVPISIQTTDIDSGIWTEIPYETGMELIEGITMDKNSSVKVVGGDYYVGMLEIGPTPRTFVGKTTSTFENFEKVSPSVPVDVDQDESISVTPNGNYLVLTRKPSDFADLTLLTGSTSTPIATDTALERPDFVGYNGVIEQFRVFGTGDRYCVLGGLSYGFEEASVMYPSLAMLRIYDLQEDTDVLHSINLETLTPTVAGATLGLRGTKIVGENYYMIFYYEELVAPDYGIEIFSVNLTTGVLTSVACESITADPNDYFETGPAVSSQLFNIDMDYFFMSNTSVDNNGVFSLYSIDDSLVITEETSFSFTGTVDQWPQTPYATLSGDVFLPVSDSVTSEITIYRVDAGVVVLPTTPFTYPDSNMKIINIGNDYHAVAVTDVSTTITVLDSLGEVVTTVATTDNYDGFIDPIVTDTAKVRFGTGVSNASSTHYVRNVVTYLGVGDVPVYLVIAYQIFHFGEP